MMKKTNTEQMEEISWTEKIEQQSESVRKLERSFKENPSAETKLQLDRATDALLHYSNASKNNAQRRARRAAELARKIALNEAVQQLPF